MRLLIDGDACPDKEYIKQLAIQYQIDMLVYIDYAHILDDDYYQVIECEIGHDSVDMKIVHDASSGDLVVTQDYGLASLLLSQNVKVLHPSGMIIDLKNIDELLMSRYLSVQLRRSQKRVKGPSKRSGEMRKKFLIELEKILSDGDAL